MFLFSQKFSGTLEGLVVNNINLYSNQLNNNSDNRLISDPLIETNRNISRHIYITCQLYSNGKLLCPSQQTPYKQMTNRYELDFNSFLIDFSFFFVLIKT